MIYETRLTLPRTTGYVYALRASMPIHPGIIKQVTLEFPAGCAGLVYARVLYWEHQIWPGNPDGTFRGDGVNLVWPEDLEIIDPPYELTLEGWNTDDTFEHTVTLRVQLITRDKDLASLITGLLVGSGGPRVAAGG